jgi:hypothetical protein
MVARLLNNTWDGTFKPPQELADYLPKTHEAAREMYSK